MWRAVAGGCTVAALVVPWASVGQVPIRLVHLPWWPVYVGLAVVMHVVVVRWPRAVAGGLVACAASASAALVVLSGHPHARPLPEGSVSSLLFSRPGVGWMFAVAAAIVTAWSLLRSARHPRGVDPQAPSEDVDFPV